MMTATQYNRINELLAEYSRLEAAFEAAEAEIKTVQLAAAGELLPKHAQLKVRLTEVESSLRKLADDHYAELFGADGEEKRTHSTPFGGLKYHKSSSLEFDDAEKVLLKIKLACERELARVRNLNEAPRFTIDQLVRTQEEPNLLGMDMFDEATLALFGVKRVTRDNFKVVAFEMKSDKVKRQKDGGKKMEET